MPVADAATSHELKLTLLDVHPPVWRSIRVPSDIPLSSLHVVVQIAMGWQDRHLHQWRVGEVTFGSGAEADWGDPVEDESSALLAEVAPQDSAFYYDYDLGDGWEHLVEVEAVVPFDVSEAPLACVAGARSCPPEDCGGPSGYEHLLDALADPDDSEHDAMLEWVGDGFVPGEFDLAATNRRLERLWRPAQA